LFALPDLNISIRAKQIRSENANRYDSRDQEHGQGDEE
jgi:hypothetical protein